MSPAPGPQAVNGKTIALNAALVRLAAHGVRPRCGEPDAHQLFLSEKPEQRALVASWCVGCPVRQECADAAASTRANFGVWGGKDRTTRPYSKGGVGRPVTHRQDASHVASDRSNTPITITDTAPDTSSLPSGEEPTVNTRTARRNR